MREALQNAAGSNPLVKSYAALARWVHERDGQVIVCESDAATWLNFRPTWETHGVGGKSREAVYVRYSEVAA
jgi:hypothetical protein